MAKMYFLTIVACAILLPGSNSETNPLFDMASAFLQNMGGDNNSGGADNLAAIGSLVGSLMQGDNAKNLGALFGQAGNGDGAGGGGDLLAGLGSLLGNQNGQIDPALIGSMVSMFAQSQQPEKREKRETKEDNLDLMSIASSLLGNKNIASFLPMIMNTVSSFSESEIQKKSKGHEDHAGFLPPMVEKMHLYWELFTESEFGKALWHKTGMKQALKSFTDEKGNLSFEKLMSSFENQSFRRHYIKAAGKYLTESVLQMAKPDVYKRYLVAIQYMINQFVESQGFPKKTSFNSAKPEKSLSALINHSLKHYMDLDTDVSSYVKSAVTYIKDILKQAEHTSKTLTNRADYNALVDRITDTLNMDIIEPVLRVYRAYKHSLKSPQCQEHLMCVVNRYNDGDKEGLPGFKRSLTKVSSMVASAALSFQNGKGFWDLFNAIQNDVNCQAKYPADCASFHEHEMKVTTEVTHTEL